MGHEAVRSACGDFRESWQYGIKQMAKLTAAVRDGLEATAQAYGATDQAVAKALAPSGVPAPSGGSGEASPFG
ncbi:hypothetical protein ACOKM3_07245 [Streptomyces sp. BH106]|uniref:hypothetical protein n=1 Tax=Streptomyces sp. BH106 TaxID=3410409 RepID=UPI003CEFA3A7